MISELLLGLSGPALTAALWVRRLSGRADAAETRARMGTPGLPGGTGPVVWIHAASNGELASARPLILELGRRWPGLRILVTTNTLTAQDLANGWGIKNLAASLAPIDAPRAVARFLDTVRPVSLVVIENEVWPNRAIACASRGIPVLAAGARMSARAFARWKRLPGLAQRVMAALALVSPQDAASGERFLGLGLPKDRLGPVINLKTTAIGASGPRDYPVPRDRTLLAASTHEGEEALVLSAFSAARRSRPDLHLIVAPRHPRRRDEIEGLLRKSGLDFTTRSRGEAPVPSRPVYLADTMGEMDRWYAAAQATFVGGSLVNRGGHTPFEPAAQGSAILTGPNVANFAPIYRALLANGGATLVKDADELAAAFGTLAETPVAAAQADRARDIVAALGTADLSPLVAAIGRTSGLA